MKMYQETTKWDYPNHTYILSDAKDKMIGYIREGQKEAQILTKPIRFDTRNRTFRDMGEFVGTTPDREYFQDIGHGDQQTVKEYKVKGSRGDEYTVTITEIGNDTCTCEGFKWRGRCKHIDEVKNV